MWPRWRGPWGFVADEEDGGGHGAAWLASRHPDLFVDCEVAIGEVGGFSVPTPSGSLYLLESAQKGAFTPEPAARGLAGHGSMLNDRNAVQALVRTVSAIADHPFPLRLTPTTGTSSTGWARRSGWTTRRTPRRVRWPPSAR